MPEVTAYLDNNATTPLHPEVLAVMQEVYRQPHNPSSVHRLGREGAAIVRKAREQLAALVNCLSAEIIFTATGSEANALALGGAEYALVSAIEHASVLNAVRALPHAVIPVTEDGTVNLLALEALLQDAPQGSVMAVMLANNETGAVQPVEAVAELAQRYGARLHVDAAQAVGKIPVDFSALGADTLTVSGHKFGGPQGAAALVRKQVCAIAPQVVGGGQEQGLRGGTENVAAIAGFGKAAELADANRAHIEALEPALRALESRILALSEKTEVIASKVRRLPNTSCIATPGLANETQLMALDLAGIAVSAGSACGAGRVEESHVLRAMGVAEDISRGAIRISTGWATQPEALETYFEHWSALYRRRNAPDAQAA